MIDPKIQAQIDAIERPIVITHGPCLDGFCAAFLAHLRWPDAQIVQQPYDAPVMLRGDHAKESLYSVETFPNWPEAVPCGLPNLVLHEEGNVSKPEIVLDLRGRDVLILDYSFKRPILQGIAEHARSVLVLDHHKSAKEDLAGLDYCVFDENRSGAGLALDYFWPGEREGGRNWKMSGLALMCEDYDLWKFQRPLTKTAHVFLETVPRTVQAWEFLPSLQEMANRGADMLTYQADLVKHIAKHAYTYEWPEGQVLAVNSIMLKDAVAEALYAKAPPPLRTSLVWYRAEDDRLRCSLRSHEDGADVSVLARKFGGGGHKHSSGFRCEDEGELRLGVPYNARERD